MYNMHPNASNYTPSYIHINSYMVLKRSPSKSPTSVGCHTDSHVYIIKLNTLRELYSTK